MRQYRKSKDSQLFLAILGVPSRPPPRMFYQRAEGATPCFIVCFWNASHPKQISGRACACLRVEIAYTVSWIGGPRNGRMVLKLQTFESTDSTPMHWPHMHMAMCHIMPSQLQTVQSAMANAANSGQQDFYRLGHQQNNFNLIAILYVR